MSTRLLLLVALLLLLGLGVSLMANRLLLQRSRAYERLYNQTRQDPLGLDEFPAGEPPAAERPLILLYGDSRARQWPDPPISQGQVMNRGIDGHTSRQALLRFPIHAAPLQPDILVLQVGVNDVMGLALFSDQRDQIVGQAQENIAQLVANTRALGGSVILTTIFAPGREPVTARPLQANPAGTLSALAEINSFLASLTADDVLLLDAARLLADEQGYTKAKYLQDTWHLNPAGYDLLNRELSQLLATWEP